MMTLAFILIALLGLIIGSFLNVVIYRMPLIMKHDWHQQSCEILNQEIAFDGPDVTLARPGSFCPHCHVPIKAWHNIPLIGFLLQKGRCQHCHQAISWRYPIVELLAAMTAIIALWRFGLTWQTGCVVVLGWGLIAASTIDLNEKLIPDNITLPLLWLGLLANAFSVFVPPFVAILGAIVGYVFFWCIAKLFYLIRGKEGMGHGDFKLLALFGAWLGIYPLLNIVIIACILGIIISLIVMSYKKLRLSEQIPFGPFLALAGWCTIIFGDFITSSIVR